MKRCQVRLCGAARALVLAAGSSLFLAWLTLTADPLDQWYRRNPLPTANRLFGVAFGNNTFLAVGLEGAVAVSADGSTWSSQNSGTPEDLYGVAYGKGVFVAVGGSGV